MLLSLLTLPDSSPPTAHLCPSLYAACSSLPLCLPVLVHGLSRKVQNPPRLPAPAHGRHRFPLQHHSLAAETSPCPHSFLCQTRAFAKRRNCPQQDQRDRSRPPAPPAGGDGAARGLPPGIPLRRATAGAPTLRGDRRGPPPRRGPAISRLSHTYPPLPSPSAPRPRPRPTGREARRGTGVVVVVGSPAAHSPPRAAGPPAPRDAAIPPPRRSSHPRREAAAGSRAPPRSAPAGSAGPAGARSLSPGRGRRGARPRLGTTFPGVQRDGAYKWLAASALQSVSQGVGLPARPPGGTMPSPPGPGSRG